MRDSRSWGAWLPRNTQDLPAFLRPTWQVNPQLERTLQDVPGSDRVCDVGAGGRRVRPDVFCVDIAPGPEVDLVADIHDLPLGDGEFGLVILTGTLNLCRDPQRALAEARRILKPGGLLHIEVGMFQPYNPEPEDYWRFTLPGLRRIAEEAGFEHVRSGVHIGPFSAFTVNALMLFSQLVRGPSAGRKFLRGAAQIGLSGVKYLDGLLSEDTLNSSPFAYGIYYVGRGAERI